MGLSRRQFTRAFKLAAIRRLEQGESLAALSRALEIAVPVLCRWREEFRKNPAGAFPGIHSKPRQAENRVADLERKIGQ
jgi:transposase-like protein